MISIIHRYIAKSVIFATILVVLIVMGLAYFINLLGELRDIGVGDYGLLQAAYHALLELPHNIYQFFPMLVLLGGLMGLGMLASHQELVVMRVSGISVSGIIKAVFSAAIMLIIIGLIMGEIISPRSHFLADKHKSLAQSGGQAVATTTGVWIHEDNNFIHIERVMPHNHLEGLTRYEFNNAHELIASYYVKSLDFKNQKWLLNDVVQTNFNKDHTSHSQMDSGTWNLTISPTLLHVGLVEPDEMSLDDLSAYSKHLVKNGYQATEFQFNFWKRIFEPLTILVMLFLAIPFVFAAPRSVSMGWRMLLGIVVGFLFYILDALLGQMSIVFQFSPLMAALLPILIFSVVGYLLFLRVQ